MLHCYICRSINKSSVHTQLSSCQLTVRHIGDPEFRTQPFYNFNMTAEVNLAKLRLPTFSSKHTSIWFRRAEASFKNTGITSEETRAKCVPEIISEAVLETIAPWLDMQPGVLKYSKLKEGILKFFSFTTQQRLDRLLSLPAQLEQQHVVSPSQVWHEINSLITLPDGKKINYAHELWWRCVPPASSPDQHNI